MRRYCFARSFCHERNTASRAITSCSCGSCGNSRFACFLTTFLYSSITSFRALASRSVSSFAFLCFLLGVEDFLKRVLLDVQYNVAEHLDEAPVRVDGEALAVAALGQCLDARDRSSRG